MKFKYRAAGPVAAAAVLTLLSACSRTQQDWRTAQEAGTPRAYRVFVARHPDSELAGVARQRIAQLTEEGAWAQATRSNTAAAYQGYLAKYPGGSWSQDARIRMESKSLGAQPVAGGTTTAAEGASAGAGGGASVGAGATAGAEAVSTGGPARTGVPSSAGQPAAAASAASPVAMPTGRRFAVQLGAFSSAVNANRAWTQLATRLQPELRGLAPQVVPVTLSGRRLYRLEARVASQDAARRLCRQLQQHSQGCLPLP